MSKLKKIKSGGNLESIKIKLKTLKNNCKYQKLLSDNSANNNKVFKLYKIIKSLLNNDKLNKDEKLNLNDLDDIKDNIFENLSKKQIISLLNKIEKIIKYNEITGGVLKRYTPPVAGTHVHSLVHDSSTVPADPDYNSDGNSTADSDASSVFEDEYDPKSLPGVIAYNFTKKKPLVNRVSKSVSATGNISSSNINYRELALKMLYLYIDMVTLIEGYDVKIYQELKNNIKSKIDGKSITKISLSDSKVQIDEDQKIKWKILGAYFLFLTKITGDTELSSDIETVLKKHSIDEKDIKEIKNYNGNFIKTELTSEITPSNIQKKVIKKIKDATEEKDVVPAAPIPKPKVAAAPAKATVAEATVAEKEAKELEELEKELEKLEQLEQLEQETEKETRVILPKSVATGPVAAVKLTKAAKKAGEQARAKAEAELAKTQANEAQKIANEAKKKANEEVRKKSRAHKNKRYLIKIKDLAVKQKKKQSIIDNIAKKIKEEDENIIKIEKEMEIKQREHINAVENAAKLEKIAEEKERLAKPTILSKIKALF